MPGISIPPIFTCRAERPLSPKGRAFDALLARMRPRPQDRFEVAAVSEARMTSNGAQLSAPGHELSRNGQCHPDSGCLISKRAC